MFTSVGMAIFRPCDFGTSSHASFLCLLIKSITVFPVEPVTVLVTSPLIFPYQIIRKQISNTFIGLPFMRGRFDRVLLYLCGAPVSIN